MKDLKPSLNRTTSGTGKNGLNAEIQSRIGHQLRTMYDDVIKQGVPDRFADLIRQLDSSAAAATIAAQESSAEKNGRD
jgi:Anti-sigma factor NepR